MPNLTPLQWLGIIILFNSTLLGSASQLGDLSLSASTVKAILAVATIGNGFLGGLVTMFGGMGAMKDTVGNMKGTTVITDKASAEASNNPNVIAATPAIVAAVKAAS